MTHMSETLENLRRLRGLHKLSQSEIGRRIGLAQCRISRWEAGVIPDSADAALRLAELLASIDRDVARTSKADLKRKDLGTKVLTKV